MHVLTNTEDFNFWRFNIDLALLDTERRVHFFADLGEHALAVHVIQACGQTSAGHTHCALGLSPSVQDLRLLLVNAGTPSHCLRLDSHGTGPSPAAQPFPQV